MNQEDKDWAVTRLSDLQEIHTISFSTRLMVAFKRGMALAIDNVLLLLLTSIPLLFCLIVQLAHGVIGDAFTTNNLFFEMNYSWFFIALLSTPIPLIYLHIFFKNYMHHATPGQAIAGIAYLPEDKECSGMWRGIKCGLARYMTAIVVAFFALPLSSILGHVWGDATVPRAIFFASSTFLVWLTLAHLSFSNKDLRSPLDRMFAMNVAVIDKKPRKTKIAKMQ